MIYAPLYICVQRGRFICTSIYNNMYEQMYKNSYIFLNKCSLDFFNLLHLYYKPYCIHASSIQGNQFSEYRIGQFLSFEFVEQKNTFFHKCKKQFHYLKLCNFKQNFSNVNISEINVSIQERILFGKKCLFCVN